MKQNIILSALVIISTVVTVTMATAQEVSSLQPPPEPAASAQLLLPELSFSPSIMFSRTEIQQVYDALEFAATQKPGPQPSQVVETVTPEEVAQNTTAPSFYLRSIMYYGPNDWIIWLNNKKLRSGKTFNGLYILSVLEDKVVLAWHPQNLPAIAPEWRKTLQPGEKRSETYTFPTAEKKDAKDSEPQSVTFRWDYFDKKGNIAVDSEKGAVRFVLSPHQSFVTRSLTLEEGFVPHTTILQAVNAISNQNTANAIPDSSGSTDNAQEEQLFR